jgi:hypothetical protein
MSGVLFEDIFDVKDIDPEGKKFERGNCGICFGYRHVTSRKVAAFNGCLESFVLK